MTGICSRFPKPATMVGNSPVPTMDDLPFKIVKMHCAKDEVIAQVAAAPGSLFVLIVQWTSTFKIVGPTCAAYPIEQG
jgi:hypothetical protein